MRTPKSSAWSCIGRTTTIIYVRHTAKYFAACDVAEKRYRTQALRFILGSYIICGLLSLPPLIGYSNYRPGKHGFSCTVNWASHDVSSGNYITILFVCGFFVPLMGTAVIYGKIVGAMQMVRRQFSSPVFSRKWGQIHKDTVVVRNNFVMVNHERCDTPPVI